MASSPGGPDRLNLMFRAFSDRTRLRMLYLLREGESCVGDRVDVLQLDQPAASRHLAYLRRAGLVRVRKAGLWSYYSLAPAGGAFHAKLLECLACCFEEVPLIREDQARARKVKEKGGCCPDTARPAPKRAAKEKAKGPVCCPRP